eukprot:GHVT01019974.1.p1 GENE.GHVT01019974.1~~GHVT01019974.1.p1  ORF type:complete len:1060 (-),score=212.41 GHVT01019974.1:1220-4399(-)
MALVQKMLDDDENNRAADPSANLQQARNSACCPNDATDGTRAPPHPSLPHLWLDKKGRGSSDDELACYESLRSASTIASITSPCEGDDLCEPSVVFRSSCASGSSRNESATLRKSSSPAGRSSSSLLSRYVGGQSRSPSLSPSAPSTTRAPSSLSPSSSSSPASSPPSSPAPSSSPSPPSASPSRKTAGGREDVSSPACSDAEVEPGHMHPQQLSAASHPITLLPHAEGAGGQGEPMRNRATSLRGSIYSSRRPPHAADTNHTMRHPEEQDDAQAAPKATAEAAPSPLTETVAAPPPLTAAEAPVNPRIRRQEHSASNRGFSTVADVALNVDDPSSVAPLKTEGAVDEGDALDVVGKSEAPRQSLNALPPASREASIASKKEKSSPTPRGRAADADGGRDCRGGSVDGSGSGSLEHGGARPPSPRCRPQQAGISEKLLKLQGQVQRLTAENGQLRELVRRYSPDSSPVSAAALSPALGPVTATVPPHCSTPEWSAGAVMADSPNPDERSSSLSVNCSSYLSLPASVSTPSSLVPLSSTASCTVSSSSARFGGVPSQGFPATPSPAIPTLPCLDILAADRDARLRQVLEENQSAWLTFLWRQSDEKAYLGAKALEDSQESNMPVPLEASSAAVLTGRGHGWVRSVEGTSSTDPCGRPPRCGWIHRTDSCNATASAGAPSGRCPACSAKAKSPQTHALPDGSMTEPFGNVYAGRHSTFYSGGTCDWPSCACRAAARQVGDAPAPPIGSHVCAEVNDVPQGLYKQYASADDTPAERPSDVPNNLEARHGETVALETISNDSSPRDATQQAAQLCRCGPGSCPADDAPRRSTGWGRTPRRNSKRPNDHTAMVGAAAFHLHELHSPSSTAPTAPSPSCSPWAAGPTPSSSPAPWRSYRKRGATQCSSTAAPKHSVETQKDNVANSKPTNFNSGRHPASAPTCLAAHLPSVARARASVSTRVRAALRAAVQWLLTPPMELDFAASQCGEYLGQREGDYDHSAATESPLQCCRHCKYFYPPGSSLPTVYYYCQETTVHSGCASDKPPAAQRSGLRCFRDVYVAYRL